MFILLNFTEKIELLVKKILDKRCEGVVEVCTMKKICKAQNCENEVKGRGKYCSYKCSNEAIEEAGKQLREKKGPIYDKWRARLKESIEKL